MYVLHYSPDSASTIVRLVLEEWDLPRSYRLIDRAAGALDTPEYRALNPAGLIPALETPDGPMFETAAILLYLSERHAGLAPAPGSPDRAAFLKWLFFTSSNIHQTLLQLFYPDRVAGPAATPELMRLARARLQAQIGMLDAMVATEAPDWLSPEKPSIFGYYIGVLIHWLASYDPDHPSYFRSHQFPALHKVLVALEARPAVAISARAEGLKTTLFTDPY